jgi:hypothetical protein
LAAPPIAAPPIAAPPIAERPPLDEPPLVEPPLVEAPALPPAPLPVPALPPLLAPLPALPPLPEPAPLPALPPLLPLLPALPPPPFVELLAPALAVSVPPALEPPETGGAPPKTAVPPMFVTPPFAPPVCVAPPCPAPLPPVPVPELPPLEHAAISSPDSKDDTYAAEGRSMAPYIPCGRELAISAAAAHHLIPDMWETLNDLGRVDNRNHTVNRESAGRRTFRVGRSRGAPECSSAVAHQFPNLPSATRYDK